MFVGIPTSLLLMYLIQKAGDVARYSFPMKRHRLSENSDLEISRLKMLLARVEAIGSRDVLINSLREAITDLEARQTVIPEDTAA